MKNNKIEVISFEYNENGRLIVDSVWRDTHYLICVPNVWKK